jgi:hypothetical protein
VAAGAEARNALEEPTLLDVKRKEEWEEKKKRVIGMPREIVAPGVIEVIIQEDGRKQAEVEGEACFQLLDDLPRGEILFVGVGTDEVEVELIGEGFAEEVATVGERFQVEELVFD